MNNKQTTSWLPVATPCHSMFQNVDTEKQPEYVGRHAGWVDKPPKTIDKVYLITS